MFCSNCGNPVPNDACFCPECGHRLGQIPPDSPSQPELESPTPVAPAPEVPASNPTLEVLTPAAPTPEPPPEGFAPAAPAPEFPPKAFSPTAPVPEPPGPESLPMEPYTPPAGQFIPPPGQYIPPDGQYPPPPSPPPGYEEMPTVPPKKKKTLPLVISIAAVVVVLAAAAFLTFRLLSNNKAFDASMTAGQESMERGDYDSAVSSFEDAVARKPKNAGATLALAEAYLCTNRFDEADKLLSSLSLEESDEHLPTLEKLTALVSLSPTVEQVDVSAFPVVTVALRLGSELPLLSEYFTLTENGTSREVIDVEQEGNTVYVTCRSEDTDISDEERSLNLILNVDGVTFQKNASYSTPHFEPAQLTLVSTDVSAYPVVRAYFRVTNAASGENIEGLTANSFTILERVDGGEYLSREVRSALPLEGNAGLNIDLVADKSDSISQTDMAKIKSVMTEFVNDLHYNTGDKAELLAFDSIVQQMCYYTSDVNLLVNGINNMSVDGMTAFYDAVYDGVSNAALQGGARCVIAFTDGLDNMSRHNANDVVAYANSKQVPVYIIGVGSSVDAGTLRAMAQNTGGRYWHIDDLYDLQAIFNQIYSEQEDLYIVEYESDAALDSYLTRRLSVQVSGGGCRTNAEVSFTPVRSINDNGGINSSSRYQLIKESLSWEEASRRCQEMGGHLATVTSQDEMNLLVEMAENAGAKYVWLGGYTSHNVNGGVFGHWVTGEEFSYQLWSDGEPSRIDQDGTEEWYIMLWNIPSLGGWTWNDQRNDPAAVVTTMKDSMAFICEFEE